MSDVVDVRLTPRGGLLFAPAGHLGDARWTTFREAARTLRRVDKPWPGHGTRDAEVAAAAVAALQGAGFRVRAEAGALAKLREGAEALELRASQREVGLDAATDRMAGLGRAPRGAYQEDGIAFLCSRRAALLLDDMGTGKTMTALSAAGGLAPRPRVLVTCPASVVGSWLAEARAWLGDVRAARIEGGKDFRWPEEGEVLAISHDALARAHAAGLVHDAAPGVAFVLDEAHAFKSAKSQRTKAARQCRRAVVAAGGRAWGLTGTPIQNAPIELWTVLSVLGLEAEAFGSWPRYCATWGGPEVVREPGAQPTPAVAEGLARVALRRTKAEVLPDLPPKVVNEVWVSLDGDAAELAARVDALAREAVAAEEGRQGRTLTAEEVVAAVEASSEVGAIAAARPVLALALLASAPVQAEVAAATPDDPLVVACPCVGPVDLLGARPSWGRIAGDVPAEERTRAIARFQAEELTGTALSIRAGGTGTTLTRSSRLLFLGRDWNPAQNAQTEDRLHRIGQTREVRVTYFGVDCWLERHVARLCAEKRGQADGALAPLAGRAPVPVAVPDLGAVAPLAPRHVQQEAPRAPEARPAATLPAPSENPTTRRVRSLAARGSALARWLLARFPAGDYPARVGPRGAELRPLADALADEEARLADRATEDA